MKVLRLLKMVLIVIVATGNAKRTNLAIMIDTTNNIGLDNFSEQMNFITDLMHHVPFSPGLPSFTIAAIGPQLKQITGPEDLINRENLLFKLGTIRCCKGSPSYKKIKYGMRFLKSSTAGKKRKTLLFLGRTLLHKLAKSEFKRLLGDTVIILASKDFNEDFNICKTLSLTCFDLYGEDAKRKIINKFDLSKHPITACNGTGKVFDECLRHCDCINGVQTNCYRIRKEFTQMTKKERARYLKAYLKLTTVLPYRYKYEKYIYLHQKYFCFGIHTQGLFCPWHRFYILQMENLLREIDCKVTLPYWDWSHIGKNPWNGSDIWSSGPYGLGGNGDELEGFCVQDGMFRERKWKTPFFNDNLDILLSTIDIYGNIDDDDVTPKLSDCLRRFFDGDLPDALHVKRALDLPAKDFADFDINLRINYHDTIHNAIGGTMCTHYAGTAPEFFLHHTFLDKIWFMWQQKSLEHKNAFFKNSTRKLIGFSHTAHELIDSHNLPGFIKVTYSKFPGPRRIYAREAGPDPEYVDDINSGSGSVFSGILKSAQRNVFPTCKRKKSERRRADYLDKLFSRKER